GDGVEGVREPLLDPLARGALVTEVAGGALESGERGLTGLGRPRRAQDLDDLTDPSVQRADDHPMQHHHDRGGGEDGDDDPGHGLSDAVAARRLLARAAPVCSGIQPVTMNCTALPMFTAWSPMRS